MEVYMLSTNDLIKHIASKEPELIFDYSAFLDRCALEKTPPLVINMYATIVTMMRMAHLKYPDLDLDAAYQLLIDENTPQKINVVTSITPKTSSGCSSCGGGKVL